MAAQAKLLRFMETKRLMRLGETREREVDVRIACATNHDLTSSVAAGRFRSDLYFRLRVASIVLPPLRERRREIPIMARHFLEESCRRQGRPLLIISPEAMQRLLRHQWPGNLRELKNLMERLAVVIDSGSSVEVWHLARYFAQPSATSESAVAEAGFRPLAEEIHELERTRIAQAMMMAGGVQVRAAQLLQMPVRTLFAKLHRYHLRTDRPER